MYKHIVDILKSHNYFILKEDWVSSSRQHPDFPQINAIAEIFNYYGIENFIAQVPNNLLESLPKKFISLLHINGIPETVLIDQTNEEKVGVMYFDGKYEKFDRQKFLKKWSGYLINIEDADEPIKISTKKHNFQNLFLWLILLALVPVFMYITLSNTIFNSKSFLLFLSSLIGVFINFFALKESLGFNNKIVNRVCSSLKKGNCNQVLRSNHSFIFKNISLSDLSFSYFLYSIIVSLFVFKFPELITIHVISLPFAMLLIGKAIYLQWAVIKKWCLLCIGISLIVLIQTVILVSEYRYEITFSGFIFGSAVFLSILLTLLLIKIPLLQYSDLIFERFQTGEIYKNSEVFFSYLNSQKKIDLFDFEQLKKLNLNELESEINLTFILSTDCDYCKGEYLKVKKLLSYFKNRVRFNLVFDINITDDKPKTREFIERLYQIKKDKPKLLNALDDYFIKNYTASKLINKWGSDDQDFYNVVSSNSKILNKYGINDTPCLLINNQLYPKDYKIEDVKYFINYFFEE